MQYYENTIPKLQYSAVTIGKFDGVHLGHLKLINKINYYKKDGLNSVVFAFNSDKNVQGYIFSENEKKEYFEKLNVDYMISYTLDDYIKNMSDLEFVENILIDKLGVKVIVVGSDFRFGKNRIGDINTLRTVGENKGFEVVVCDKELYEDAIVEKKCDDVILDKKNDNYLNEDMSNKTHVYKKVDNYIDEGMSNNVDNYVNEVISNKVNMHNKIDNYYKEEISSTLIKKNIIQGNVLKANKMLGHLFEISGIVSHGKKLGRTIGFPTANIMLKSNKISPCNGVYAVNVIINERCFRGIADIGNKPTVGDDFDKALEVHIFDFNEDIYGEFITVQFLDFIRKEKKFNSINELKKQIDIDVENAKLRFTVDFFYR